MDEGLQKVIGNLSSINFEIPSGHKIMLRVTVSPTLFTMNSGPPRDSIESHWMTDDDGHFDESHTHCSSCLQEAKLCAPTVPTGTVGARDFKVYPTECRQRYTTYKGNFSVTLSWWLNGVRQPSIEKSLGPLPIMVRVSDQRSWLVVGINDLLSGLGNS